MHTVVLGWLAGLFAVMAAMLVLAAAVVGWPILLLALPLAGVAYLFWYHASGRLTERLREQARRRGTAQGRPGSRRERRAAAASAGPGGFGRQAGGGQRGAGRRRRTDQRRGRSPESPTQSGMRPATARGVLGVTADADADAVRSAYRSKVKDVHPDRGGSTEAFKRVNEAYETLDGEEV